MITPISLESDVDIIKSQITKAKLAGSQRFHIDIIDGLYADNLTVAPADLQEIDLTGIQVDLHLLVDDPAEWIEECIVLKPTRILAQVERMGNVHSYIDKVKGYSETGIGLGLGIKTPISSLDNKILERVDAVLLMAIEPGFGGTPFQSGVIPKIRELRSRWGGWIIVDGGINPEILSQVLQAGASEAGANSAMWRGDFEDNWRRFAEVK